MKPGLAVTEVALGHHGPCPAQRDVPVPVPVPVSVPVLVPVPAQCWEGPNLVSSCSCRWDTFLVCTNKLFEPFPSVSGSWGLHPSTEGECRQDSHHAWVSGGYWLHLCLDEGCEHNCMCAYVVWRFWDQLQKNVQDVCFIIIIIIIGIIVIVCYFF